MLEPGWVTIAAWSQYPWLRAGFSTRQGGASTVYSDAGTTPGAQGPGEQNLGFTAEDSAATVAGNRLRLVSAVAGTAPMELVTMQQFHSGLVSVAEGDARDLTTAEGKALLRCDGLITRQPGLLLGVMTADCVPVLLADTRTRAVACFHAGWRGTLARIVEHGVGALQREFGSDPTDLIAAIGPAIGACCFAVGEEVRSEFNSQFAYSAELFSHPGSQFHLDLAHANRRQLLDAGLRSATISLVNECTACSRLPNGQRKYFSHRAERGCTGRMLSLVGVAPEPALNY